MIVATLTDNVTAATKVVPGGTINYTATITNNGAASPADDATNLNFSAPLERQHDVSGWFSSRFSTCCSMTLTTGWAILNSILSPERYRQ